MINFNELIALEYENAYDLSVKRNFSNPKIYSANGDLTKRWYVYFSFRDPKSGKLKRLTPFYGNANKYKTKEDRMSVLVTYRKVLLRLLKQGYNPYTDNSELHHRLNAKNDDASGQVPTKKENKKTDSDDYGPKMSVREALDFGLYSFRHTYITKVYRALSEEEVLILYLHRHFDLDYEEKNTGLNKLRGKMRISKVRKKKTLPFRKGTFGRAK